MAPRRVAATNWEGLVAQVALLQRLRAEQVPLADDRRLGRQWPVPVASARRNCRHEFDLPT